MNPFDRDGLWLKAKLFVNKALDPDREFEEQAFWACSALELLGKAALANVSPLLVASPTDDGKSLFVAAGLSATTEATSVQGKAVWARCGKAFRPFDESEAKKLTLGRNEYIHSAGLGFDALPPRVWWQSYWGQVILLLRHLNRELADFVEPGSVAQVEAHLAARRDSISQQLEARLESARTGLRQHEAGTLSGRAAAEWLRWTLPQALYSSEADCPACAEPAVLGSTEKLQVDVDYDFDAPGWPEPLTVSIEAATAHLACPNCHLVLRDYELLAEAGIALTFMTEGDLDDVEYAEEYNNE